MKISPPNKIFYPLCFFALAFFIFIGLAGTAKADVVNTATSTSAVKDFGSASQSITLSWTASTSAGVTAIAMQVRSGATASPDGTWTAWTAVSNSGEALGANMLSNRYLQYRAIFTSTDINRAPRLDDVTINQAAYPASSVLLSSPYDSGSADNLVPKISWTATGTSTVTAVKFQIRSAVSTSSLLAAPWCGYADTGDTCTGSNYFNYTKNGRQITDTNHPLLHGLDDRYFQYKAIITSDGQSTPIFDDVAVTYVVNAPPEFSSSTSVSQRASDGKVAIHYSALDSDTAPSGVACPNCVVASFRYSLNNGASWTSIPDQYLSTPAGANQGYGTAAIAQTATDYQVLWDAKSEINGATSTTVKIEMTLNDQEGGNNTVVVNTDAFALDVANPSGAHPIVVLAKNAAVNGTAALINLSVTDDSPGLQMCMTLDGTYATGCVYGPYNSTSSIVLTADPKRVYVSFKDFYQNTYNTSAIAIEAPNSIIIKDVSTLIPAVAYQEFIVWKAAPPTVFKAYHVEHSVDGVTFTPLTSIGDSSVNFYFHSDLVKDSWHYYRVYTEDTNGDTSFQTAAVSDKADGAGGTSPNPPVISNVEVIATTTQTATIEWDTNEMANSSVHYSTDLSYNSTAGSLSMAQDNTHVARHHVVLTDLLPGQTYHFTVESVNALSISGVDTNESNGYEFKTVSGPKITNVTANSITNNGATIVWNTDIPADSNVYYSTSTALASFANAGDSGETASHEITLANLEKGTPYYYYVTSGVATDDNGGAYYTFSTPSDNVAPLITLATATLVVDTQAVITWTTNEMSDSTVVYGTEFGVYTASLVDANLAFDHKIILSSLATSTTYYYKVISIDASGNEASSTAELSFTTLQRLSEEEAVVFREQQAQQAGEIAGAASKTCGNGGSATIDRIKPTLSAVRASVVDGATVKITWRTDKLANSLAQYGTSDQYHFGQIDLNLSRDHEVVLYNLSPASSYLYKAYSIDANGNLGQSGQLSFTTSKASTLPNSTSTTSSNTIVTDASFTSEMDKAINYLLAMADQVSVSALELSLNDQYNAIRQLSDSMPAPLLSGEPRVLTTSNTATITWSSDKKSNSLVAIAPEGKYDKSKGANAYTQVVGNPTEAVNAHLVTISELQPETVYHYQVRSMTGIGALGQSVDFTFKTKPKELAISDYAVQKINAQTAIFKWVTTNETDSSVKYIPFRNGVLAVDSAATVKDKNLTTLHQITVDNFESGIHYEVDLSSSDIKGNTIGQKISSFSTGEDNFPPTIYQVQTESALSTGKESNVQTIISWLTDEPATAQVFYQQGAGAVNEAAWEKSPVDPNYSKKHIVVLTKFIPGQIYQFKMQSADSNNNLAISKVYTILAPKQKESVFQIIIKNFEEIFGWTKNLNN